MFHLYLKLQSTKTVVIKSILERMFHLYLKLQSTKTCWCSYRRWCLFHLYLKLQSTKTCVLLNIVNAHVSFIPKITEY